MYITTTNWLIDPLPYAMGHDQAFGQERLHTLPLWSRFKGSHARGT